MSLLRYEIADGIATITLNRPDRLNAFNLEMIDLWVDALRDARANDAVQVVVVTGAGRAFCSGGDVGNMAARDRNQLSGLDHKRSLELIHRVPLALNDLDKPVIAALNGAAVGAGLDMALMCDLRYAAEGARFSEGYVKVGLIPGDGGTFFLPRLVGVAKALELFWTGDFVDAREAERIGMINRVVPADGLLPTVYELAGRIARGPSLAIRTTKRAVYQSLDSSLPQMLDYELDAQLQCFRSGDAAEGIQAFVAKRSPVFAS